jgi:hypothetical protein
MDSIRIAIDKTIKNIWGNEIYEDYANEFLLKEDTLKNSIYYHLRKKLTDEFFYENDIRIFTEYDLHDRFRADIVIVKLRPEEEMSEEYFLQDRVLDILAIIEIKYKNTNLKPFESDILKVKKYIQSEKYPKCQYYLAFICEDTRYEKKKWIDEETWIRDNVTILDVMYDSKTGYFEPRIKTYNAN